MKVITTNKKFNKELNAQIDLLQKYVNGWAGAFRSLLFMLEKEPTNEAVGHLFTLTNGFQESVKKQYRITMKAFR